MITILLLISFGLIRLGRRTANYWGASYYYGGLVSAVATTIAAVVILTGRYRYYRDDLSFPSVGSLFTVLIGAIIGSFSAKYVWSMFGLKFGRRDPLIGAVTLFLISVAYCLPLYHKEISGLLSDFGISTIKTSFIELTFAERSNNNRGGAIGATVGKAMATQALPRSSDPKPGLEWLSLDVNDDAEATIGADKQYIIFCEPTAPYKDIISKTQDVLLPVHALVSCLIQYIKVVPDSQLLLVDIKPVLESFFKLHSKAKELPDKIKRSVTNEISAPVQEVLNTINSKFGIPECEVKGALWDKIHKLTLHNQDFYYLQPYTVLVLADLLVAHGATDEAISVLAEWLTNWDKYKNGQPEWFMFRVASRLSIFMFDAAGQYNIAYREFLKFYKSNLEHYMGSSNPNHIVSLAEIPEKCKSWIELDNTRDAVPVTQPLKDRIMLKERITMEQRASFVLLINEHEALRTELAFLTEESNFEALQKLAHRANFLASIEPKCLPKNIKDLKSGIVATNQVTAGLLNLSVADRMTMLARSSGDRERALDIRHQGRNTYGGVGRTSANRSWTTGIKLQNFGWRNVSLRSRAMNRRRGLRHRHFPVCTARESNAGVPKKRTPHRAFQRPLIYLWVRRLSQRQYG
ncbi:MAG: hypothetical protein DLM68_00590 [Hyphomicrobiales bacterium]|nr:MAG: hypothetical protein DLM68_00590 [Hyphomicrobiales bacterium]